LALAVADEDQARQGVLPGLSGDPLGKRPLAD
jgi:hypothetical protein